MPQMPLVLPRQPPRIRQDPLIGIIALVVTILGVMLSSYVSDREVNAHLTQQELHHGTCPFECDARQHAMLPSRFVYTDENGDFQEPIGSFGQSIWTKGQQTLAVAWRYYDYT